MKIGFDAKRAFYNHRGLGHYSRTLIRNLYRYHPDHQYLLFSPGPGEGDLRDWNKGKGELITPTSFLGNTFSTAWRSLFLTRRLQEKGLDIYHGLSHELPPRIDRTGIASVVTIHDLLFMRFPQFYPWIDRKVYKKKFSYSVKTATKVIAICEQTKRDIVEFLDCPEEKIEVVYQSCGTRFRRQLFYDQKGEIQEKYQLPSRYLLYVGALEENKNILSVIKALGVLKRKKIEIPFFIVGSGESYRKKLELQIKKEDIASQVRLLGKVSSEDLVGLYQNATSFIFPSFFEGFGIPIIEALSSGLPVITSKGFAFEESGGPSSYYTDPNSVEEIASGVEKVFHDDSLREKMSIDGLTHVEKFSGEKTASHLMAIYKSLL